MLLTLPKIFLGTYSLLYWKSCSLYRCQYARCEQAFLERISWIYRGKIVPQNCIAMYRVIFRSATHAFIKLSLNNSSSNFTVLWNGRYRIVSKIHWNWKKPVSIITSWITRPVFMWMLWNYCKIAHGHEPVQLIVKNRN